MAKTEKINGRFQHCLSWG